MNKDINFFDSCAANWDAIRVTSPARLHKLLAMAAITPGSSVLDVGSGTGVLLPYLASIVGKNGRITAVDFSSNMLSIARQKYGELGNITFTCGDILELQMPPESFDAVTCLNFYPHLNQRKEEFLHRMLTLLKNGGKLIIMHDISREQVNGIHGTCDAVKEHRLPAAEVTQKLLEQCGYKKVVGYEDDEMYFVSGKK